MKVENFKLQDFVSMKMRPPANIMARLHMQILAKFKFKPIKSSLQRPIASFSFDDIPKTAVTNGAKILEQNGALGTFYVAGSHIGQVFENVVQCDENDIKAIYNNGHEIACHSYSHPRLRGRNKEEIIKDLNKNLETFREILGDEKFEFSSHAFPYGEYDETTLKVLSKYFTTMRGVLSGVNFETIDFANLKTTSIEVSKFCKKNINSAIDLALKNNGWIVFFTHDINENCTNYGSTPAMLEEVISMVKSAGIEILPVKDAAIKILK